MKLNDIKRNNAHLQADEKDTNRFHTAFELIEKKKNNNFHFSIESTKTVSLFGIN